ncbi:cytochrome-c peroxidase [Corallococcus sp. H22C18031201]|uniref:cytochrome-c peroxidase n=1 Tax=Citreicoccus inhibens TaxID=2849499 RepID=UPI000E7316E4|nr:cytochrome c peroxidase [Citreicoccus inhibens]MBU8898159.1 c-type cytochrome [Citreicoccus inhibens]RJS18042.1 cytochrome-c peroxidase [Corallococcus sp. H22C18031201]
MRSRRQLLSLLTLSAVGVGSLAGCERSGEPAKPAVAGVKPEAPKAVARPRLEPAKLVAAFQPPKGGYPTIQDTEAQVSLGRMLFFETRLSKNQDVSCNTCHGLDTYGVDNKALSEGHRGQKGTRNSPTVYDAAHHVAQFWDGRADTLEAQAKGPMLNPVEMAMPDAARVVATLSSIPEYTARFRTAFPGESKPVSLDNTARAIAAFERQLITASRFDRFLMGEHGALSEQERRGLETFVSAGCTTCHNGPAVGGTSFQKLGLVEAFPGLKDPGRFEVTHEEDDLGKFRVPGLRNVEKTGPYLHDGSVTDLPTMVRLMGRHQLGRVLTDPEVDDLVSFLKSLTGALPPTEVISAPALPASTKKTPKADPS